LAASQRWPRLPNARIVNFCYSLPARYRHDRAIIQTYLQTHLGLHVFPPDYSKETFAQVLPELISKQARNIAGQLSECALSDLGLVDQRAVLSLLREVETSKDEAQSAALAFFLWKEWFVRLTV